MGHKGLRDTAALLLHVVRVLETTTPRTVRASEIKAAVKDWSNEFLTHRKSSQRQSTIRFNTAAKGWLRFQGLLKLSQPFLCHFDVELTAFTASLVDETGYCASTLAGIKGPTARFLYWAAASHDRLSSITYGDLDTFMDQGRAKGWRPATARCYCLALRTFFRYAEKQGWCKLGLWRAIVSPVVRKGDSEVISESTRDLRSERARPLVSVPNHLHIMPGFCFQVFAKIRCERALRSRAPRFWSGPKRGLIPPRTPLCAGALRLPILVMFGLHKEGR